MMFQAAQEYAAIQTTDAQALLDNLKNAITSTMTEVESSSIEPIQVTSPSIGDMPIAVKPERPSYVTTLPDMEDVSDLKSELGLYDLSIDTVTLPILEASMPGINFPEAPTGSMPAFDGEVPALSDPSLPSEPTFTLPSAPHDSGRGHPQPSRYRPADL